MRGASVCGYIVCYLFLMYEAVHLCYVHLSMYSHFYTKIRNKCVLHVRDASLSCLGRKYWGGGIYSPLPPHSATCPVCYFSDSPQENKMHVMRLWYLKYQDCLWFIFLRDCLCLSQMIIGLHFLQVEPFTVGWNRSYPLIESKKRKDMAVEKILSNRSIR